MKRIKILPFEDDPYSKMYHHIAFPMGIIQGNAGEDITPWLCGKYINCSYEWGRNSFTIYTTDMWSLDDRIMFEQKIDVDRALYDAIWESPITLFRKMLNLGYYIGGLYNEEYIPGKYAYQKKYLQHDFLLIGYDDIRKKFLAVSYLQDRKFQRHLIPYDNMEKAVETLRKPKYSFYFYKFNDKADFRLDLSRVVDELNAYLHSSTTQWQFASERAWGMEAMQCLSDRFDFWAAEPSGIDNRFTRGFMEHKFYMHMRMRYLWEHGFLNDEAFVEKANRVYQMSESVRLLCLKYNMTGKTEIMSRVHDLMAEILLIEREYLSLVLGELQNQNREVQV